MDNVKHSRRRVSGWWQARRPTTRRLVQLYSALLHNAYIKGFITGEIYRGNAKVICSPGLNCYSCPAAVGACPLGAIQNALASANHRAGWYVLGIVLLFGVILGRVICGWLCPMGLLQELLNRIPTLKLRKSRATRVLSWLKYLLLSVFVIAIPLWYALSRGMPLPAFCKYICPAGTLEGAVGLLSNPANAPMFSMLGLLFTRKFIIMVSIGLACVFCYRAFCRFLCPLGAIYGLFNRFSIVCVQVDEGRCNRCGACVRTCGMDVCRVGDHECIQCGKCMEACAQNAISIKAGRIALKAPDVDSAGDGEGAPLKRRRPGRTAWGIAVGALCLALLWFNALDPVDRESGRGDQAPAQAVATESVVQPVASPEPVPFKLPVELGDAGDIPLGHEVGQQFEDFTLTCYDGSVFQLSAQRGKVTFINFWATHCEPCMRELPYFDALYRGHEGDIAVIAVHSSLVTKDPVEYLSDKGYAFSFATDSDDTLAKLAGGTGTLPQTVVLDRRGEVVYNKVGSVTLRLLEALYSEAAS